MIDPSELLYHMFLEDIPLCGVQLERVSFYIWVFSWLWLTTHHFWCRHRNCCTWLLYGRSLLSPWYSTRNPAGVLEICQTDHGIWHSGGICMEYNGNCIYIAMSCNSVQSLTRFHEKKLKFHGMSNDDQPLPTPMDDNQRQLPKTRTTT